MKEIIMTKNVPAAIGPYSQGVKFGNMVFTSGQLPINSGTGEMPTSIEEQAKQSMNNVKAIVEEAGCSMKDIIKVTIFLKDLSYFAVVNEIYNMYFEGSYPARSCIEISRLPKDALIEIEAIAVSNN